MIFKIARNQVDKKGLEADEKGTKELALYFDHVKVAQEESQSFWAAYLDNEEMLRDQVDLALEIESHVSKYEMIYNGTDECNCSSCGERHRFNY